MAQQEEVGWHGLGYYYKHVLGQPTWASNNILLLSTTCREYNILCAFKVSVHGYNVPQGTPYFLVNFCN